MPKHAVDINDTRTDTDSGNQAVCGAEFGSSLGIDQRHPTAKNCEVLGRCCDLGKEFSWKEFEASKSLDRVRVALAILKSDLEALIQRYRMLAKSLVKVWLAYRVLTNVLFGT